VFAAAGSVFQVVGGQLAPVAGFDNTISIAYGIGPAGGSVVAVGDFGYVARNAGAVWTELSSGHREQVRSIFNAGFGVWASNLDHLFRWDGGSVWTLESVSPGNDPGPVWARGSIQMPEVFAGNKHLVNGVWKTESTVGQPAAIDGVQDDVWFAYGSNAIRYNGIKFDSFPTGVPVSLTAIKAIAKNDVWAVGSKGAAVHWNGSAWSVKISNTSADLTGVWGSAATDVWAVGASALVHWNGSVWTPSTVNAQLVGISGTSASDIWAPAIDGGIQHYDGHTWIRSETGSNWLYSVSGDPTFGQTWVGGPRGQTLRHNR
jgi:hypothetical protein